MRPLPTRTFARKKASTLPGSGVPFSFHLAARLYISVRSGASSVVSPLVTKSALAVGRGAGALAAGALARLASAAGLAACDPSSETSTVVVVAGGGGGGGAAGFPGAGVDLAASGSMLASFSATMPPSLPSTRTLYLPVAPFSSRTTPHRPLRSARATRPLMRTRLPTSVSMLPVVALGGPFSSSGAAAPAAAALAAPANTPCSFLASSAATPSSSIEDMKSSSSSIDIHVRTSRVSSSSSKVGSSSASDSDDKMLSSVAIVRCCRVRACVASRAWSKFSHFWNVPNSP